MLEAVNVSFGWNGRELLRNVNLELEAGQMRVLFGPSGSGKSTLIRVLAGFETPVQGEVFLDGKGQSDYSPREWRRRVVLLHQEPRMFPGTVEENLTRGARYHGLEVRTGELLEKLDLNLDASRDAADLSGGEKKRLALGRALAVRPDYLLLDEPSSSLDESTRETIDELILQLVEDFNLGILVVTHNPDEVQRLGARGYRLREGTLHPLDR